MSRTMNHEFAVFDAAGEFASTAFRVNPDTPLGGVFVWAMVWNGSWTSGW